MSKSDGNTISPQELFTGNSDHISKAFSPMVIKFFMLQAHYRSPLNMTDEALQAAEKGYKRLMEAFKLVCNLDPELSTSGTKDQEILGIIDQSLMYMDDDFNVPNALASLFELASILNSFNDGHIKSSEIGLNVWNQLKTHFNVLITDIFGLKDEQNTEDKSTTNGLMHLIIDLRKDIRERKDWASADKIRDSLFALGIQLKDGKDGTSWKKN